MRHGMAVALFAAVFFATADARSETTYTMGVVPQWSPARLAESWVPIISSISYKSGATLKFQTAPDIEEFHRRVYAGQYDVIYVNPLVYVFANKKQGYQAFAKEKDKKLVGIIVVRTDSLVKTLADLKGKKMSMPPASAFAANLLNRGVLAKAGVQPGKDIEIKESQSHDSAYLMVFRKQVDAAGGVMRTLKSMPENVQGELRVLSTTPGYTPHAFAAKPSVPAAVVAKIRDALVAVGADPANRAVLDALQMASGFDAADDAAWADSREFASTMTDAP